MKFETTPIKAYQGDEKIAFPEKLAYGCGGLADVGIAVAMSTYLLFYYTDVIKVNAAAVGTIFLVSRLLSAFFIFVEYSLRGSEFPDDTESIRTGIAEYFPHGNVADWNTCCQ